MGAVPFTALEYTVTDYENDHARTYTLHMPPPLDLLTATVTFPSKGFSKSTFRP